MPLKVVELAPGFSDTRQNLASHYLRQACMTRAIQQCCDGLVVSPRSPALRRVLGSAYSLLGMKDEAIAVYRHWLQAEPDSALARFHLTACTGHDVPAA